MTLTVTTPLHALATLRTDQKTTHAVFEETLVQLRTLIDSLRDRIATLTVEVETLQGRIAAMTATKDGFIASLGERIRLSDARIAGLTEALTASQAETTKACGYLAAIQQEIANNPRRGHSSIAFELRYMYFTNAPILTALYFGKPLP